MESPKQKRKDNKATENSISTILTIELIETYNNLHIDSPLLRTAYFTFKSFIGIMLPVFILFPTDVNYYSGLQKTLGQLYFHSFSTLDTLTALIVCGGCFLLVLVEKICFFRKKMRATIIVVLLMNLLAPALNPIFMQLILRSIMEGDPLCYLVKVLAGLNVGCILLDAIYFEVFLFTFSLNSRNKLCRIQNKIISARGIVVILLSIVLPAISNANKTVASILELVYMALPLLTLCKCSYI